MGTWFSVTGLKGDVNAATLQGGIVVAAAAGAGFGVSMVGGGQGADTLTGGAGNDTIEGGEGADTLTGGQGQDTMDGGAGADLYIVQGTQDSGVLTALEPPAGWDVVTVGEGDLFDFHLNGLGVYTSVWTVNAAMATTGSGLLAQFSQAYLDAHFNDGLPKVAMPWGFWAGKPSWWWIPRQTAPSPVQMPWCNGWAPSRRWVTAVVTGWRSIPRGWSHDLRGCRLQLQAKYAYNPYSVCAGSY